MAQKNWSHGLLLVSRIRDRMQRIPQVHFGYYGSVRNRTGRSRCCCCCCYVSFNMQEHFELLWRRLSNKSKYSQLLIDYIFQEHDKGGCFHWWMIVFGNSLPGWIHMAKNGQAIAYILLDPNCSCSTHYNLIVLSLGCCTLFPKYRISLS